MSRWHHNRARLVVITAESLDGDGPLSPALSLAAQMMTYTTREQLRSGRDPARPGVVKQGKALLVTEGVPLRSIQMSEVIDFLGG